MTFAPLDLASSISVAIFSNWGRFCIAPFHAIAAAVAHDHTASDMAERLAKLFMDGVRYVKAL